MSRALGAGDDETVRRSTAFGIYGSLILALLLSLAYLLFSGGFLKILGADAVTEQGNIFLNYLVYSFAQGLCREVGRTAYLNVQT